ncbi:MAG: tRNA (5-methylaminomethyl-2-thiouridine)(34)-methyltransferase MnmD [Bacteroidales bacterium]
MKRELIKSADGSNTLRLAEYDESYHSVNGALTESNYIFIGCGLKYYSENVPFKEITILEAGFGTGLNCLLTGIFALKNSDITIHYSGIEKYPVTDEEFHSLNHIKSILEQQEVFSAEEVSEIQKINEMIQLSDWDKCVEILPNFTLTKTNSDILLYNSDGQINDIVYFDAFSPGSQPELWTREVFGEIYKSVKTGGILVTYSSKGIVKQALRESGFDVLRLNGPPGKRHIVRATRRI